MSHYSINYDNGIALDSFEKIKCSYSFIVTAVQALDSKIKIESEQFFLRIGEINTAVDSYEEFVKVAFGQPITLREIDIHFKLNNRNIVTIIMYQQGLCDKSNISIMCYDKGILEKVVASCEEHKKELSEKGNTNSATIYQTNHIEIRDNATIIGSNIAGYRNQVVNVINDESSKEKKGSIFKSIWENLVANWIWWILGIAGAALLTWWGIKK